MAGLVLTDASPLIGLARVEGLPWLRELFGAVWMPAEVRSEMLPGFAFAEERAILEAESAGWLAVHAPTPSEPALPDLDEGEAACIRIGLSRKEPVLLLMDERAGRALAVERGLRVAGTAVVIGMAKTKGLIPSAREVFARLHGSDFRVAAPVIEVVLRRVGEWPA